MKCFGGLSFKCYMTRMTHKLVWKTITFCVVAFQLVLIAALNVGCTFCPCLMKFFFRSIVVKIENKMNAIENV